MDLEQLNKSQIVMLTMLVSFMTSIATGIVTVSLMQQAPLAITETVNRVVERTVEKVVPGQPASVLVPIKETVFVKETDPIAQAVEKSAPSVVRIYTSDASSSAFLALGVVVDSDGTIATDANAISAEHSLTIEMSGSLRVPARVISVRKISGVAFIAAATSTSDGKSIPWKSFSAPAHDLAIGQTVVAVGGKSVARIGQGILTAITTSSTTEVPTVLETSVAQDTIFPGGPLIDSSGNVLGITTSVSTTISPSSFIPGSLLTPQKHTTDTSQ